MRAAVVLPLVLLGGCGVSYGEDPGPQAEDDDTSDGGAGDDVAGDDDTTAGGAGDSANVFSAVFPSALVCGASQHATVVMQNIGTTTWTPEEGYKLGAVGDQDDLVDGDVRVYLQEGVSVAPGETHAFSVPLTAGAEAVGSFLTDWQMVHEGVQWFGEIAAGTVDVTCDGGGSGGWTCIESVRNGSEICDDQAFTVPSPYQPMVLVCESATGGIAYVSDGTGPPMDDGVSRCQGWEEDGLNAWDYLHYLYQVECQFDGQTVDVDLSPWAGQGLWVGSHDHPAGGGHMNQVCIALRD